MNKYIIKLLIAFVIQFFLMAGASSAIEKKLVYEGLAEGKGWFNQRGTFENGVFKIKAHDKEYFEHLASVSKVVKNGKEYLVEFLVKIHDEFDFNRKFEFVVRPKHWLDDVARVTLYGGNPDFQKVSLRFNAMSHEDPYSLYFYAAGGATVEIKDVKLYEAKFTKFYPVTSDAKPYKGDLGKLPTGSEDFEIDAPKPKFNIIVKAEDFGVSETSENNASALVKALDHCKKIGAAKLVVKKGVYKCFEDVEVVIKGVSDFVFDGGGSTFIFRKKKLLPNIHIVDCTRCEIKNFNMDWDWKTDPLAAIVKVEKAEKNPKGGTCYDVRFIEYKRYPLYNKPTRVAHVSPYDMKAQSVGVEGGIESGYGYRGWDKGPKTEWLEPNLLRIYSPWDFLPPVGSHYRLQHFYYDGDGFAIWGGSHLTFENINVYSCRGAAFYFRGGMPHHCQMKNVDIKVPRLYRRPITSTCDHLFFSNTGGYFKMIGCEFSRGADDCLNIHDPCSYGRKIGKRTISAQNCWLGYYAKGDKIEFRDSTFAPVNFVGTVKSAKIVDHKNRRGEIEFEEDLPEQEKDGFVLFNRKYRSKNVIVKDCYFHSNRARGLLIISNDVTIENCKFRRNEMGALKFETGYTLTIWCEGQGVDNVVVRNCDFDTSNPFGMPSDGYERDIFMGVYIKRDPSSEQTSYPILSNILFENNRFKDTFGLVAYIASTGNVTFKNNVFENPTSRNFNLPYRGQFYIQKSSNAKFVNNVFVESPNVAAPGFVVDESAKDTLVEGNRLVKKSKFIRK